MTHGTPQLTLVNNHVYESLGESWYRAEDDPVALLRAESRLRNPWIAARITQAFQGKNCDILDVGCGGGFLSNYLGGLGHRVVGLDASPDALAVAAQHDPSKRVRYQHGNALDLPFANASFDAVCALDFLEHVENPERVIAEAARVLRPSGLFFFHTFNRSFLAWLVVIKGVEWFVRNTPRNLHVLRLFLKPAEVRAACQKQGLRAVEMRGMRPAFGRAFWKLLFTRRVPADFGFRFCRSTGLGFCGVASQSARLEHD
jgi:2-polyprenyl-6-hydroxyphenyl methylase/3-demethylubiquinone-9 3-methyltransferase